MHHGPGFAALAWGAEMIVVMSLIVASPCLGVLRRWVGNDAATTF